MLNKIKKLFYYLFFGIYWIACATVFFSFIRNLIISFSFDTGEKATFIIMAICSLILSIPTFFLLKFLNKKTRLPIPVIVTIFMILAVSFFG